MNQMKCQRMKQPHNQPTSHPFIQPSSTLRYKPSSFARSLFFFLGVYVCVCVCLCFCFNRQMQISLATFMQPSWIWHSIYLVLYLWGAFHCIAMLQSPPIHIHTRTRDCTNGLKNLRVFVNTVFFLSFAYLLNRTALDFCLICFFLFLFVWFCLMRICKDENV